MFKIGCAEAKLEVPLFTELYGYGHYAARRNIGVHEELYCRAFSFFDGEKRAVIVYSDICTIDAQFARELRSRIASKLRINPEGIALVSTHTHSGPALSAESADTSGIRNRDFENHWKTTVVDIALKAFLDEEDIASADTGKAPLAKAIGTNRVEPETNITDPAIRWIRFKRADGTVKLICHNHAAHGIADNGPLSLKVSSDWMGAANRIIKERKIAENVLYLQGPAGDINTRTSCSAENRSDVGTGLGAEYAQYLADDLDNGVPADLGKINFVLRTFDLPVVRATPEELRSDAESLRSRGKSEREKDYWAVNAQRLEEMAFLTEKGFDLGVNQDLQVIRIGDVEFFFVPGELYVEPGMEIMNNASGKFPFLATVSNGSGQYFFTEKSGLRYPSISCTAEKLFGFYEIYAYMHQLRFKYQNNICPFLIDKFRDLDKSI